MRKTSLKIQMLAGISSNVCPDSGSQKKLPLVPDRVLPRFNILLFLYRPFHLSSKKKYLRAFVQADTIQIGGDEIITAISAYIPDHGHNAITAYIQPMQHQESQFRLVSDTLQK